MICNMCGNQNELEAKFCSQCGHEMKNQNNENNIPGSIIRKSIKQEAKLKNKKPLCGLISLMIVIPILIFASYFFIIILPMINNEMPSFGTIVISFLVFFLLILTYIILSIFFNFGLIKSSLDISRGKQLTLKEVISSSFKNAVACLKLIAITAIMNIILGLISVIPIIGIIAGIVLVIYFIPVIVMVNFILADNPKTNMSLTDIVKQGMNIIKNHRVEFYGLLFSFAGWFILSIFTAGLLMIWLIPYLNVSLANFYRHLTKEETFQTAKKGLSNGMIIAITVTLYILFVALAVILLISYKPNIEKSINSEININDNYNYQDYDYDDTTDKTNPLKNIKSISGLNIYIPEGYSKTTVDGYNEAYQSLYGDVIIGVVTQDIGTFASLSEFTDGYKSIMNSSYTCGLSKAKNINQTDWEIFDCGDDNVTLTNYMTLKENKIYAVIITYANSSLSDVNKNLNDFEENLSFTN